MGQNQSLAPNPISNVQLPVHTPVTKLDSKTTVYYVERDSEDLTDYTLQHIIPAKKKVIRKELGRVVDYSLDHIEKEKEESLLRPGLLPTQQGYVVMPSDKRTQLVTNSKNSNRVYWVKEQKSEVKESSTYDELEKLEAQLSQIRTPYQVNDESRDNYVKSVEEFEDSDLSSN